MKQFKGYKQMWYLYHNDSKAMIQEIRRHPEMHLRVPLLLVKKIFQKCKR